MNKAMQAAQKAAKKAIENQYEGLLTVTEYQDVTNPVTHITHIEKVVVLENQLCKLSFETITTAIQTETAATISQAVKLFVSPDITIKAGSMLTVTQNGVTTEYTSSGVPAVYPTHQEIMLELSDRA